MDPIWLKNYPTGVPAEIDAGRYASLTELMQQTCTRHAAFTAFSSMGTAMTYGELDRLSRHFAAWLQQGLGLKRGERVALMMPNLLQFPVAIFGILRAGLVVVNVNPQYTVPELAHQLQDSGASAIVVLENFALTVQTVLEQHPALKLQVVTTQVGDLFPLVKELLTNAVVKHVQHRVPAWHMAGSHRFNAGVHAGQDLTLTEVPAHPQDTAFLQYTGGTTGVAKGAMLSHGNLVANVLQLSAWIGRDLLEAREIFVCPLPLYHVYALSSCLVFLNIGAHTVLVPDPRDMHAFIRELKRHPFTAIIGVNTLYRALLDAPDFAEVDTRSLKMANAGGMAVQRKVAERWKAATGVPLVEAYGLTETSPGAIANPLNIAEWTGNIGMPLPSTQAAILEEDGTELPVGAVGEICVRGPQVMQGYWQRPQETAKVLGPDGWLRTGDMGFMDERGCFTITDRKKDMIIVSGFKVFPNQIEDVIALLDGVAEVAAVATPDDRSGEAVKVIVVRSDLGLTQERLLEHCRAHLTDYKVPKFVEFRSSPLPKTPLGKILRRELRDASAGAAAATALA